MDTPNIALPPWLPWATTACLAALVACLGELWIVEKTRTQLLRDEGQVAAAALQGAENQLAAERILNRREVEVARSTGSPQFGLAFLSPPDDADSAGAAAPGALWGIVVWEGSGGHAVLRISGLSGRGPGRHYQLWLEGGGPGYPSRCASFAAASADAAAGVPVSLPPAVVAGSRFVLVEGAEGDPHPEGPGAAGSIVLATPPYTGRISGR